MKSIIDEINSGKICPYCYRKTDFIDSAIIYKGVSYGMMYSCTPCDAYVGTHKGTDKALGRLANSELRYWKKEAHAIFDRIWKEKLMRRSEAYQWLCNELNIEEKYCHIGMFNEAQCKAVVIVCKNYFNNVKNKTCI